MTIQHGLMRIFWPLDIPSTDRPGVLVGWRNSDLDVTVVSVLHDVEVRSVQSALQVGILFRGTPYSMSQITERCGNEQLEVLGVLNAKEDPAIMDAGLLVAQSRCYGHPPDIRCPRSDDIMTQIVLFERPDPNRMQYLSLTPISLTLENPSDRLGTSGPPFDGIDAAAEAERKRKHKLVQKLKLHTVIKHPRTDKELALMNILNQINSSYELDHLMQRNIGLVGVRMKRTLSVGERVVESATNLRDGVLAFALRTFQVWIWPVLLHLFILGLVAHRAAGEILLQILEWRLLPDSAAFKDISATAQQVDIRLQQFCYWPTQYLTLRRRRSNWASITNNHPEYIRFYNSLWLVANDVIIGIAIGSYIIDNADYVAGQVSTVVDSWFVDGLQRMISWLMDWPAGLKLNTELANFLGDLFLWVIEYWAGCMQALQPSLPRIVRFIGFSSFAGASMPISMFSDLVSILTIHIYSFYIASARIYNWQLSTLVSLFHLFRGKKRNVLRNRIDSCDYDLDQLLLGTILFALLTFILPTIGVFYATFASARMGIIVLKAALDTWLACLNHFPLFALMLRIKDSRRLPGGIRFELQDTPSALSSLSHDTGIHNSAPTAVIKLKSIPLPLTQTFSQYFRLGHRIRRHYLSARVFLCLLTGRFVPPIHRKSLYSLQYSMLPAKRVSVGELWRMLIGDEERGQGMGNGGMGPMGGNGAMRGGDRRGDSKMRARSQGRRKGEGMWWSK